MRDIRQLVIALITLSILVGCNSAADNYQQHQEADLIIHACVLDVESSQQSILALLKTTDQENVTYRIYGSDIWAFVAKHADPNIDECTSDMAYDFVYNRFNNAIIRTGTE